MNPVTPDSRARPTPLLVLDLDGTVRHNHGGFVNNPADVHIYPEALDMMRRWRNGGGRVIAVSNQGGIALGHVTWKQVEATMRATNLATHGLFDQIMWCPHHPDATGLVEARCWCRKPSPGLIVQSIMSMGAHNGECYPVFMGLMVGDQPSDQECARLAGLDFEWADAWRARARVTGAV